MVAKDFISNKTDGNRARQWRDQERECVRDGAQLKEGDGIGNKIDCQRETFVMDS